MPDLCPLSLCRSLAGGFRGGRATLLAGLVPFAAILASACGDDDGDPPGAMVDGGIQTDAAPPGDVDAGSDTADAAPACGRTLDRGVPVNVYPDPVGSYAWVPSSDGLYVVDRSGGARVIPLDGCPD